MSNFLVNEASVFTTRFIFDDLNPSIVIPSGARTIDILNLSRLEQYIEITGNQSQGGLELLPVSVAPNVAYSFVDLGKPYPAITVLGGFGATVNVVACY